MSNVFMTAAWYGTFKGYQVALWQAILISWGIAFFEYCLQVPANRYGSETFSKYQLKIIQEVITLVVFVLFAMVYFKEYPRWNHIVAFVLILGAVCFAMLPTKLENSAISPSEWCTQTNHTSGDTPVEKPDEGSADYFGMRLGDCKYDIRVRRKSRSARGCETGRWAFDCGLWSLTRPVRIF